MPRSKGYQLNSVFANAIPYIREYGYKACNMNTLIARTSFNRRAFYIEFANKLKFFEAVCHYYIEHELKPLSAHLFDEAPADQQIMNYFLAYGELIKDRPCMLVKLLSELDDESANIHRLAQHFYDELTQCFISCLERAQKHHHVSADADVEAFALQLIFLTQNYALCRTLPQGQNDIHILINKIILMIKSPAL